MALTVTPACTVEFAHGAVIAMVGALELNAANVVLAGFW